MQHIITDEEIDRFTKVYQDKDSWREAYKAALADFLNNRPESTLGKLRPIAEMPEKVPEGCVRLYFGAKENDGNYKPFCVLAMPGDTHAIDIDIQLPTPDPEAEERQRFEEAMKASLVLEEGALARDSLGGYVKEYMTVGWTAWKLAKAK